MSAPPRGVLLAAVEAIPDPGAIVVHTGEDEWRISLILTRSGGAIAAFRNSCPHAGYPLQRADGRIAVQEGRFLVCAAHGASYRLDSGACAGGPCNGDDLERIEVDVRDGLVFAG